MLIGSGRSNRRRGGRSRRARYFSGRLTRVEVIAIATTPRSAARRARSPPKIAMAAAIVSQSIDRLALLLNRFRLRSTMRRSWRVRRSKSRRSKASSAASERNTVSRR